MEIYNVQVLQVAPSLYMFEMRKSGGDTLEFHKFYKNLTTSLKDIVWKTIDEEKEGGTQGGINGAVVAS
ncbi:BnaC03g76090D [Brassica napus]|uniref:BnaC03g76090D protein n=1 Tax=Brassica napus TaxID=3708 RepID=A0A078IKL1_BRANA|nr:BnaC03g76090D [Brassica napus]